MSTLSALRAWPGVLREPLQYRRKLSGSSDPVLYLPAPSNCAAVVLSVALEYSSEVKSCFMLRTKRSGTATNVRCDAASARCVLLIRKRRHHILRWNDAGCGWRKATN